MIRQIVMGSIVPNRLQITFLLLLQSLVVASSPVHAQNPLIGVEPTSYIDYHAVSPGIGNGVPLILAQQFRVGANSILVTSIEIVATNNDDRRGLTTIYNDRDNSIGDALFPQTLSDDSLPNEPAFAQFTNIPNGVVLQADTVYWISLGDDLANDSNYLWYFGNDGSNTGSDGDYIGKLASFDYESQLWGYEDLPISRAGAFRINGTLLPRQGGVPESSIMTFVLVMATLLGSKIVVATTIEQKREVH